MLPDVFSHFGRHGKGCSLFSILRLQDECPHAQTCLQLWPTQASPVTPRTEANNTIYTCNLVVYQSILTDTFSSSCLAFTTLLSQYMHSDLLIHDLSHTDLLLKPQISSNYIGK